MKDLMQMKHSWPAGRGRVLLTGFLLVALATFIGIPTAAYAQAPGVKVSNNDREFATRAAQGGMAEVEASKLALKNGSSADVKKFAQNMITDHSEAVAGKIGVPLPSEPNAKQMSDARELGELSGAKFDRMYINQMVDDHEATVALFEKQAKNGDSPELKAFAGKTLPTLQEHLKMIKAMKDRS